MKERENKFLVKKNDNNRNPIKDFPLVHALREGGYSYCGQVYRNHRNYETTSELPETYTECKSCNRYLRLENSSIDKLIKQNNKPPTTIQQAIDKLIELLEYSISGFIEEKTEIENMIEEYIDTISILKQINIK